MSAAATKKIHDARREANVCINQPNRGPKHGKVFKADRCKVCYVSMATRAKARNAEKRKAERLAAARRLIAEADAAAKMNGMLEQPQLALDLPSREQTQFDCDTPPALSEPVERTGDP